MIFDFLFKKEDKHFKASKAEFDSIMTYAYVNAIEVSKVKIIKQLDHIQSGYHSRLFLCILELFHIARYCETIMILANQYRINDEYEISKMIESTEHEVFNLAVELYNNRVKDPIASLNEEIKRIENRLDDFTKYCRLIAMSDLKKE